MKRLKRWQVIVLVIVIIALCGGGYGIYSWVGGSQAESSSLSGNTQLVTIQYGSITNSVSTSGSLVFPNTKQLTFGSAGNVVEVYAKKGETVAKGQPLAKLDDASLQKAVIEAQIALNEVLDTTDAEVAVINAQLALRIAEENLEKAQNPYSTADILQAQINVAVAEMAFTNALSAYDTAETLYLAAPNVPGNLYNYELKRVQLELAHLNLAEAKETLAEIKAGADPLQIELREKQLVIAQDSLDKAEAELAALQGIVTSPAGELKQMAVKAAQADLDSAISRLEAANMVAPFSGVITAVNIDAGDTVNASTTAIQIVDYSVVEVSATLDEIDVPLVEIGQEAVVTLSSLSDVELSGEVSDLSTTAKTQSGVVTYSLSIRVTVPSDIKVMEGMTAYIDIITEEAANVLRVPVSAIGGTDSNPTVRVLVDGVAQERAITTGVTDGSWTEILTGLQAGEQVIIEITSSSSSSSNTNTNNRQFPGGGSFIINEGGGGFAPPQ